MLTGLWSKSAEPPEGTDRIRSLGRGGVSHRHQAAQDAPRPMRRSAARRSISIIAQKIGAETLLPSLQLAVEDPNSSSSNCGEGLQLFVHELDLVDRPADAADRAADADGAAADGAESAGGVRAPVRQRRDAGGARRARSCSAAASSTRWSAS